MRFFLLLLCTLRPSDRKELPGGIDVPGGINVGSRHVSEIDQGVLVEDGAERQTRSAATALKAKKRGKRRSSFHARSCARRAADARCSQQMDSATVRYH
jgi:hypothetical protein